MPSRFIVRSNSSDLVGCSESDRFTRGHGRDIYTSHMLVLAGNAPLSSLTGAKKKVVISQTDL